MELSPENFYKGILELSVAFHAQEYSSQNKQLNFDSEKYLSALGIREIITRGALKGAKEVTIKSTDKAAHFYVDQETNEIKIIKTDGLFIPFVLKKIEAVNFVLRNKHFLTYLRVAFPDPFRVSVDGHNDICISWKEAVDKQINSKAE